MDKFIILLDSHRDVILGLNWQFNYKIGSNFKINGHHYMTHNSNYLCTSIPLEVTKHIIQNEGAFSLQSRCVSIITVQAPTELKSQHMYMLTPVMTSWMN